MKIEECLEKSPFQRLGLMSAAESFAVFLVSGFLLVVVGGCFVELTKDLPTWYVKLIEEPMSIAYFFILSIVSLLLAALFTWGGTRDITQSKLFEWFILAPSRAGISCGAIASGMLLGIGAGLFIVTRGAPESELVGVSTGFLALGLFCLAVAYPVAILMAYLIDPTRRHRLRIDILGVVYLAFVIYMGLNFSNHLDWIAVSAEFAVLIVWILAGQWLYK